MMREEERKRKGGEVVCFDSELGKQHLFNGFF